MPHNEPTSPPPTRDPRRKRAAAYVVALLVTTVLAAMVLVFAREMRVQTDMATQQSTSTEARWIAQGAIEAVRGDLATVIALGEAPRLDAVSPQAELLGGGLFWLIRPNPSSDSELDYGLIGEGGKLHLDQLTQVGPGLIEMPGMSENLIAALIDWQDRDEEVYPGGAEASYYLSRPTPYNIKNRDLETVGEMLYVRGVTPELYYGEDANRNGVLDPNENDGSASAPNDNANGNLDRGFVDLFTVYSLDPELSDSGEEKVSVDIDDDDNIDELAGFLRQQLGEERGDEVAQASYPNTQGNTEYESLLEFYIKTELTEDEFALIHDGLKRVDDDEEIEGLIDVYSALPEVLDTLPGLEPGDGQLIVDARPKFQPGEPIGNIAWLVGVLGEDKAAAAGRFLTHRSYQFTADIVALSGDGRSFCRLRVVLDCVPVLEGEATLPVVRSVQDLTSLGWPLPEEIRDQLRFGNATAEEISSVYRSGTY